MWFLFGKQASKIFHVMNKNIKINFRSSEKQKLKRHANLIMRDFVKVALPLFVSLLIYPLYNCSLIFVFSFRFVSFLFSFRVAG